MLHGMLILQDMWLHYHTCSRFDAMIAFGLPDQQNREEIAAQYAKHLTKSELTELALASEG